MSDNIPHHELPPVDDLAETALFKKMRAVPAAPNPQAEQRAVQMAFDDVLSKLGTRAVAAKPDESDPHYLATLCTQAAAFGPDDMKRIDYLGLANDSPAALAEMSHKVLEVARAEIERPLHSLKPGETREVTKIDRAGRPIVEFYNKENSPSFWMNEFKGDVVRMVSGGTAGISTEDHSGTYRFDKSHIPEYRAAAAQLEYQQSAEFKTIDAYARAGLVAPPEVLAKVRGK